MESIIGLVGHEHLALALENYIKLFTERPIVNHKLILLHLFELEQAQCVQDCRFFQPSFLEERDVFDQWDKPFQSFPVSEIDRDFELLLDQLHYVDLVILINYNLLLSQSAPRLEQLFGRLDLH